MIRRLFVLLLVSIILVGGSASFRPAQSASSDPCKQDHAAWLTQVLGEMSTIKPGMTRWDVLHVFRAEEGAPRLLDGRRTTSRITTRNICQSGLPLFQN